MKLRLLTLAALLLIATPAFAQYRPAFDVVLTVARDYPGLIVKGTPICGEFVDQVAHRLNRQDGAVRWGRKARQADGGNPNCDGLAYLVDVRDRSRKVLVDIIVNGPDPGVDSPTAAPAWQEFLGDNVGNGFWTEPVTPDRDGATPPPVPPPSSDAGAHSQLLDALGAMQASTNTQLLTLAELERQALALLTQQPPTTTPPPANTNDPWWLDFLKSPEFKLLVGAASGYITALQVAR